MKIFSSSSASNINGDKLMAIQLELTNIDKEMNRLRNRRFKLLEQQRKLKEARDQNQQLTTTTQNSKEQWSQEGY